MASPALGELIYPQVSKSALSVFSLSFPTEYPDGADHQVARATSLGEATVVIDGEKLNADSMASWFKIFYRGFGAHVSWFRFSSFNEFEIPFLLRVSNLVADNVSIDILTNCISPSVFPTGLSPVSRSQVRSYGFYYPAVVARQLGSGQIPPCLFYSDKVRARAPITSSIEFHWVVGLTDDLNLGVFANLVMDPSSSRPYIA